MPTEFPISAFRTELGQIVESVFTTMLALEVHPHEAEWEPLPDQVTAAVYFAGTWQGAVLLECGRSMCFEFTRLLMPVGRPEAMNNDVRDTMGELTNMLAGNLKSVLPRGVGLSIPSVVEGADYSLRLCGGNLTDRLCFQTDFGPMWVTLIEVIQ